MLNKQGSIQMKVSKLFSAVVVASAMLATVADAASIGRSGGSSGRSSSSFSSGSSASKPSAPSRPAVAPAPAVKPGGIGGTQGSMGVRKSEVTAPVANNVQQSRPQPTPTTTPGYSNPGPTYGSAPTPNYGGSGFGGGGGGLGAGGVFMSSLGGSLAGNLLGNALFGHSSHGGGTTVINNGTPSAGGGSGSVSNGVVASGPTNGFDNGPGGSSFSQPTKKEYTVWSFIADIIGFVFVVAILLGVAWLFYKGFKMVKNFVNRERGVATTMPFQPTARFWEIQRAFAAADVSFLKTLLGPDLVDEATNNLTPSTITLHNVSYEVKLTNPREFSVHYTFEDAGEVVDQVWHYELHDGDWKLNGIETV